MNIQHTVTKRIHAKKTTIKAFATENGFSVRTVYELIHRAGYHGTFGIGRQILEALLRRGFITNAQFRRIPFKDSG